jgi:hypothetical protein
MPWNMMSPDWPWKAIRPEPPLSSQTSHSLRSRSEAVVHAGRRLHAQRVELGGLGEQRLAVLVLQFGEARNDAAAVAEHADRAAFPEALAGFVRGFQLAQQVDHHVVVFGQALEAGDETGPRAALELVEQGGVMGGASRHCVLLSGTKTAISLDNT